MTEIYIAGALHTLCPQIHLRRTKNKMTMKKKRMFSLIALMLVGAHLFAGNWKASELGMAVLNKGNGIYKVVYEGETKGNIKIDIYDGAGTIVYSQRLKDLRGFICPLNFAGMDEGSYTVRVTHDRNRFEQTIDYSRVAARAFFVRAVPLADNRFAILSPNVNEYISVQIYNRSRELVCEYTEKATGNFGKVFNMSAVSSGPFTFVVSTEKGTRHSFTF